MTNRGQPPLHIDKTHKHTADTIVGLGGDTVIVTSFLSGDGAPASDIGVLGDHYLDEIDTILYGPKDDTGWGSGTSLIGPAGPQGAAGSVGTSLTFKGAWAGGTAYSTNDWVSYQGNSYAAVAGSTGVTPGTDATKWAALAISGAAGATGPQGDPGADGPEGPAGPDGPAGTAGADGPAGAQGAAGVVGPKGDTGAQGAAGSSGAQGVQGTTGARGDPGPVGPSLLNFRGAWDSAAAYQSNDWITYSGTSYFALAGSTNVTPGTNAQKWVLLTVNGPVGAQGVQGIQGVAGAAGTQGPAGAAGAGGATGATGAKGDTGATGPAGAQGPAGPAGPSGAGQTITGRLVSSINSTQTTFSLFASDEWPVIPGEVAAFKILCQNEMMRVTAISSGVLGIKNVTVVRHVNGTAAASHSALKLVTVRPSLGSSQTRAIELVIDGGAAVPTTGSKGILKVPFACDIIDVELIGDVSGSAVVDIKKGTPSSDTNMPSRTSICASAKPTLSSQQRKRDATLTGWTTALNAGDILEWNLDSISTIKRLTVALTVAA